MGVALRFHIRLGLDHVMLNIGEDGVSLGHLIRPRCGRVVCAE